MPTKTRRAPSPQPPDSQAAEELHLYITNDGDLYRQQRHPIEKNLTAKMASGKYNAALAEKLWLYLADNGAKKYARDFATAGEWNRMFSVPTRKLTAQLLNADFVSEYQSGNFSEYIPKKYQPKPVKRATKPNRKPARRKAAPKARRRAVARKRR